MPNKKRSITSAEAIREGTYQSMKRDKNVYIIGEGIQDPKRIFGTTEKLLEEFGQQRVIETPVSENAMTGICIGSAMMGLRPIQIHQRVDFALLSLEQIFNNAAKAFFVSNQKHKVPIVIRMIIGRGWGQGPMHSQIMDTLFSQIPGLKVLMPTFPKDFKGMLISAIQDNNPVIFLENRWLHNIKGNVPKGYYKNNINRPTKVLNGKDITVVANGYNLLEMLEINKVLKEHKIEIDLFDLNVIQPLNINEIIKSVKKTKRILTLDSGFKNLGIGSEITSRISEKFGNNLKSKPRRLGLPFLPTPSSRFMAKNYYITKKDMLLQFESIFNIRNMSNKIKINKSLVDVPDLKFKGPF